MSKLAINSCLHKRTDRLTSVKNTTTYHEIDFLLPAQRFNINFTYITQKGLPFVREFVLRLTHLGPMTKLQIASFFGFSRNEAEEAIDDLVERDELTLNESGRLMLTEKSSGYFTDIGEVPRLSFLRDSGACLSFDLATFTCLGKGIVTEKWKAGIQIKVDDKNAARSEAHVEKHFQRHFNEIFHKGFLSKSLEQDEKDSPTVYTVNSVNKIRQLPLRLSMRFQVDIDGRSVEREDFDILKSSDYVHERIAVELDRLARPNNTIDIAKAMFEIGDSNTLKLFDAKTNSVNFQYLADLAKLEENNSQKRITFLGPIYSQENWGVLQQQLAPVLMSRIESNTDVGQDSFVWLAPSDPYWGKSNRLSVSLSDLFKKASTKDKKLYSPTIYLPVSGQGDYRTASHWKQELDLYDYDIRGLTEGFLGGNVEVLLLEGSLVVVVYHMALHGTFPVTIPLGFISTDKEIISSIGRKMKIYLQGSSGTDSPNDCGLISRFSRGDKNRPLEGASGH